MRLPYVIPAAAIVIAVALPVAAFAEAASPDTPTQAALTKLRTGAAAMVSKLSNPKGVSGSQVAASYEDQFTDQSAQRLNTIMVVKNKAERAAWTEMDPTSRALIKNFFAAKS